MIKDDLYLDLKKISADNKDLSNAELTYIDKMQQLDHMCDFRPDWFPPDYRKKMEEKLQSEFHKSKTREERKNGNL